VRCSQSSIRLSPLVFETLKSRRRCGSRRRDYRAVLQRQQSVRGAVSASPAGRPLSSTSGLSISPALNGGKGSIRQSGGAGAKRKICSTRVAASLTGFAVSEDFAPSRAPEFGPIQSDLSGIQRWFRPPSIGIASGAGSQPSTRPRPKACESRHSSAFGGLVQIRCLAPLGMNPTWRAVAMRQPQFPLFR
jgi:hypothetical protein